MKEKVLPFNVDDYGPANFDKAYRYYNLNHLGNQQLKDIATRLSEIDNLNFSVDGWDSRSILFVMASSDAVSVLLLDESEKIIGYTVAVSAERAYDGNFLYNDRTRNKHVAYIANTVIHPDFQGKKLIAPLMEEMEKQLKLHGYSVVDRDAMVDNGYAAKIEKHYGSRIITQEGPNESEYGKQMYFRIKL